MAVNDLHDTSGAKPVGGYIAGEHGIGVEFESHGQKGGGD
jgi:hypothetical protein